MLAQDLEQEAQCAAFSRAASVTPPFLDGLIRPSEESDY
jgi:hypothetical protein